VHCMCDYYSEIKALKLPPVKYTYIYIFISHLEVPCRQSWKVSDTTKAQVIQLDQFSTTIINTIKIFDFKVFVPRFYMQFSDFFDFLSINDCVRTPCCRIP
jgi:hypothetical protein